MLKTVLFAISLSLCACGSAIPDLPEMWQCAYSIKFDKFRCVNTETGKAVNVSREDSAMEAAQCLSADDYKKSEAWVKEVKRIAEKRCR